jgi:hypothetical protein
MGQNNRLWSFRMISSKRRIPEHDQLRWTESDQRSWTEGAPAEQGVPVKTGPEESSLIIFYTIERYKN